MPSTIRGSDNMDSAGVEEGKAKAWVNFDGTGTPSIRASFNVSSITDNGVGDYNVNFTTPMQDANGSAHAQGSLWHQSTYILSASVVQIGTANNSHVLVDSPNIHFAIFR